MEEETKPTRLEELKALLTKKGGYLSLSKEERAEYSALKKLAEDDQEGEPIVKPSIGQEVGGDEELDGSMEPIKKEEGVDYKQYKVLPPPIVEYLEYNYGNWLNYFEIKQVWQKDFGGYGIQITIPKAYSTEPETRQTVIWDNRTRTQVGTKEVEVVDFRSCPLKDLERAKSWLDKVKNKLITDAYSKGIRLPNTNTAAEETTQTRDDYVKSIHQ